MNRVSVVRFQLIKMMNQQNNTTGHEALNKHGRVLFLRSGGQCFGDTPERLHFYESRESNRLLVVNIITEGVSACLRIRQYNVSLKIGMKQHPSSERPMVISR